MARLIWIAQLEYFMGEWDPFSFHTKCSLSVYVSFYLPEMIWLHLLGWRYACFVMLKYSRMFIMMKIMHYLQHCIGNVSLISSIIFSAIKAIMPFLDDKESHHFIRLKLPLTRGRRIQECKAVIARFNLARKTILC